MHCYCLNVFIVRVSINNHMLKLNEETSSTLSDGRQTSNSKPSSCKTRITHGISSVFCRFLTYV